MLTFLYLLICFMLPNIAWQLLNRKRLMRRKNPIRHIVLTCIFWGYCALTIHVTGIGTIWDIISYKEITGGFNLIPFSSDGIKTYILNDYKFRSDLHTHMNANLDPDILIALGIHHQIRYPLYYIKKLKLRCTPEQEKLLAEKVDINNYYMAEMDRLAKAGRKG